MDEKENKHKIFEIEWYYQPTVSSTSAFATKTYEYEYDDDDEMFE